MAGIRIKGYGHRLGDRIVPNREIEKQIGKDDAWIRMKTGIESRHYAETLSNCDMAAEAAQAALERAGARAADIDLLIACTFTPDAASPSLACLAAGRLGLEENTLAFDLNGACSGFVYGMAAANSLLASGGYRRALVIGSEKISPLIDPEDRGTGMLFADGAGALVLEYEEDGFFYSDAGTRPDSEVLGCPGSGGPIYMSGQEVYRFAVGKVPETMRAVLDKAGMDRDAVDHYVCHQANLRIIESAIRKLGADQDRFYINIQRTGNTSAASIPICLSEMLEQGILRKGETVLCSGFGAGLTWGSMLLRA